MKTMRNILLGLVALTMGISMLQAQGNNVQKKHKNNAAWQSLGPGNISGRILAVHVDIRNSQKIYAGTAGGGLWMSANGGASWDRCKGYTGSVAVTAITQHENGRLFIGTGEAFGLEYPELGTNIEESSIPGDGVYTTMDGITFEHIQGTETWLLVNDLEFNPADKKIYAATEQGLFSYSESDGNFLHADGSRMVVDISIGRDGTILYANYGGTTCDVLVKKAGEASFTSVCGNSATKIPTDIGRTSVAIAPSNPNIMYAYTVSNGAGSINRGHFMGVYRSVDKGNTWEIIFKPGSYDGPTGHPTNSSGMGYFTNLIAVHPDTATKLYVGTVWLYEGNEIALPNGSKIYSWMPKMQRNFYSVNYSNNTLYFGTNGEIMVSTNGGTSFNNMSAYLYSSQVYSFAAGNQGQLALSVRAQGTMYMENPQTSLSQARYLSGMFREGINCVFSSVKQDALFYADRTGTIFRQASINSDAQLPSQWYGDFSQLRSTDNNVVNHARRKEFARWYRSFNTPDNVSALDPSAFLYYHSMVSPILFWESTQDMGSIDTITYLADKTYAPLEEICVPSERNGYPIFIQNGADTLHKDSALLVQDIVTSRFFLGGSSYMVNTTDAIGAPVFMTNHALDFNTTIGSNWNCVFRTKDGREQVIELQVSKDGDQLFILTRKSDQVLNSYSIYRVSGFNTYRTRKEMEVALLAADPTSGVNLVVDNPDRMLKNDTLLYEHSSGDILSITLDPQDNNNLVFTTNDNNKIQLIEHVLDMSRSLANGDFTPISKAGGLHSDLNVYTAIIEMDNSNVAFIGTDKGVYKTENFTSSAPNWVLYNEGIDVDVPIFKLYQQTKNFKTKIARIHNKMGDEVLIEFPGVSNRGIIYAGTHGLGMFMDKTYHKPLSAPNYPTRTTENALKVYPNPTNGIVTIDFSLQSAEQVQLNIVDITGKIVLSNSFGNRDAGTYSETIDCSNLSPGLYFVSMKTNTQNKTSKIILAR